MNKQIEQLLQCVVMDTLSRSTVTVANLPKVVSTITAARGLAGQLGFSTTSSAVAIVRMSVSLGAVLADAARVVLGVVITYQYFMIRAEHNPGVASGERP